MKRVVVTVTRGGKKLDHLLAPRFLTRRGAEKFGRLAVTGAAFCEKAKPPYYNNFTVSYRVVKEGER